MAALAVVVEGLEVAVHPVDGSSSLLRCIRHSTYTTWRVKRLFSAQVLSQIGAEIARCELTHSGQVRFAVEGGLALGDLLRNTSSRARAVQVFSRLGVWDTDHNNGVLIYLSLADRIVEIIADRGVNAKVGDDAWAAICQRMQEQFSDGQFLDGVKVGVREVSAQLQKYFPPTTNASNELPDDPVVLR